jgi:hypothetical protein
MPISRKLLAIIGRRFPAIYDVPRGPLARVALNPQPLPPAELGAAMASEFVHSAWIADRFGLDPGLPYKDLDDWCPTGPKKLKLPPWWPPVPEPEPHPDWAVDFHLGFAARLSAVAEEHAGTRLGESLSKAIDRSVAVIEAVNK